MRVAVVGTGYVGLVTGDGSADLQYVLFVAKGIGANMKRHMFVVDKSTVPVGTAEKVRNTIQEGLDKRGSNLTFDVISNPEFLKEGSAVADCMKPDRVVIGVDSKRAEEAMRELYKPYFMNNDNLIFMDIPSAEMTKYAANSMLATKISFMNEISNICERVGAMIKAYDPKEVDEAKACYLRDNTNVRYCESKYEALKDADALILITEWKEFRSSDFYEIGKLLKMPVIFDGRNQYEPRQVKRHGLDYYQIGVRPVLAEETA